MAMLPGQDVFHKGGKPWVHRKHYSGAGPSLSAAAASFYGTPPTDPLPTADEQVAEPEQLKGYFGLLGGKVYFFTNQLARATWKRKHPGAQRITSGEARERLQVSDESEE